MVYAVFPSKHCTLCKLAMAVVPFQVFPCTSSFHDRSNTSHNDGGGNRALKAFSCSRRTGRLSAAGVRLDLLCNLRAFLYAGLLTSRDADMISLKRGGKGTVQGRHWSFSFCGSRKETRPCVKTTFYETPIWRAVSNVMASSLSSDLQGFEPCSYACNVECNGFRSCG
jgi:hypothetical protein